MMNVIMHECYQEKLQDWESQHDGRQNTPKNAQQYLKQDNTQIPVIHQNTVLILKDSVFRNKNQKTSICAS